MGASLQRRFESARVIAQEAAALARALQPPPGRPRATTKGAQDWLTEADTAVEALVRERLAREFTSDGFLGEESAGADAAAPADGLRWVVDPIDGTSNYARGRSRWCVSIGLMDGPAPLLGVLACPAAGETFAACAGMGATLNDTPVQPSGLASIERAMVELSWSSRVEAGPWTGVASEMLASGVMPRSEGSGALGLADVACGRLDGFVELHINLWDVAGALALLSETGCMVRHDGFPGRIAASTPGLGREVARFAGFDADPIAAPEGPTARNR